MEIPSLTCAIHRNKARAVGTSALFTNPAGAGVIVANVLLFVLYRAEVCWPSAETRAGTPGGPSKALSRAHSHTSSLQTPISPISKQASRFPCSCFPCLSCSMILGCSLLLCRVLSSAPLQTLSGPAIHHSNPRSDEVLNELQLMRNGCHSVWDWIRSSAASTDNGNFFFKLRKKKEKRQEEERKQCPPHKSYSLLNLEG